MLRMPKHQRGMFAPVLASTRPAHVIWGALEELTVKPRCHLVIDLETLATTPNAKILSIGAVAVCAETGSEVKFYAVTSTHSQHDSHVSHSTAQWWGQQSGEARQVLDLAESAEAKTIDQVLAEFTDWVGELGKTHTVYPWGNGATFDVSILEYAFHKYGGAAPWNFRNTRDMRTLRDVCLMLGLEPKIKEQVQRVGTHHNALDDAQYQARIVTTSLKALEDFHATHASAAQRTPDV